MRFTMSPGHPVRSPYEVWELATPPTGLGRTLPKQVDGPYASPWFWIVDITASG